MRSLPALCAGLAAVACISGIVLSGHYLPAPEHAHAALAWFSEKVPSGLFLRGLHVWSTSLLIGVCYLLVFSELLAARYRGERQHAWWCGIAMLLAALGLGFTGSLLPWTQHAYWDAVVRFGIMEHTPLIGASLVTLARGGDHIGLLTLVRFNTLHVHVLALLFGAALIGRLCIDRKLPDAPSPVTQQLVAIGGILLTIVLSIAIPAYLGAVADPASTGYEARPEWWFFPLFQLRKVVSGPNEVAIMITLLTLAFGFLIALPKLDPTAETPKRTLIIRILSVIGLAVWLTLMITGALDRPQSAPASESAPAPGAINPLPS